MNYSIENLAIYALVSGVPALLLMNIGGVLADKLNRKLGLILIQSISVIVDLLLLVFFMNGYVTLSLLLGYGGLIGILGAFSRPFSQSILLEIINKEDVAQILGVNSVLFNLCRIFVPTIVGILLFDKEILILVLSIIFSFVSLTLYSLVSCKPVLLDNDRSSFSKLFREQKLIFMEYPKLIYLFTVAMVVSITLGSYTFLIPALNDLLHNSNPSMLSYMYGISGLGALTAGLLKIKKINIKINFIPILGVLASICMLVLVSQNAIYIEFITFYILALAVLLIFISCSQAVYEMAPPDEHGRLLSLLGMAVIGTTPFSNAMTGFLVGLWGLENICLFYAVICGFFCLGLYFKMSSINLIQKTK